MKITEVKLLFFPGDYTSLIWKQELMGGTDRPSLTMTRVKSLKEGAELCEEINMVLFSQQAHTTLQASR